VVKLSADKLFDSTNTFSSPKLLPVYDRVPSQLGIAASQLNTNYTAAVLARVASQCHFTESRSKSGDFQQTHIE